MLLHLGPLLHLGLVVTFEPSTLVPPSWGTNLSQWVFNFKVENEINHHGCIKFSWRAEIKQLKDITSFQIVIPCSTAAKLVLDGAEMKQLACESRRLFSPAGAQAPKRKKTSVCDLSRSFPCTSTYLAPNFRGRVVIGYKGLIKINYEKHQHWTNISTDSSIRFCSW